MFVGRQYINIRYIYVTNDKNQELLPLHNVQYEKKTHWTSNTEKIRLPVVQYGENNVRSHVLNGCF